MTVIVSQRERNYDCNPFAARARRTGTRLRVGLRVAASVTPVTPVTSNTKTPDEGSSDV